MLGEEDVEKINKWVKRLESKRRAAAQRKIGEQHRGGGKDWRIKTKENIGVWKKNCWKTSQGKRKKEIKVKLSKLEITKFNWNHLGWICFWIQYERKLTNQNYQQLQSFHI